MPINFDVSINCAVEICGSKTGDLFNELIKTK